MASTPGDVTGMMPSFAVSLRAAEGCSAPQWDAQLEGMLLQVVSAYERDAVLGQVRMKGCLWGLGEGRAALQPSTPSARFELPAGLDAAIRL